MFLPFTIRPEYIEGMTKEQLDAPAECMCGKQVPLKDCIAVWTHRAGEKQCGWFPACHPQCVVIHVVEGSA
jgi:hypothetical protein